MQTLTLCTCVYKQYLHTGKYSELQFRTQNRPVNWYQWHVSLHKTNICTLHNSPVNPIATTAIKCGPQMKYEHAGQKWMFTG